jgi:hypothetical protein
MILKRFQSRVQRKSIDNFALRRFLRRPRRMVYSQNAAEDGGWSLPRQFCVIPSNRSSRNELMSACVAWRIIVLLFKNYDNREDYVDSPAWLGKVLLRQRMAAVTLSLDRVYLFVIWLLVIAKLIIGRIPPFIPEADFIMCSILGIMFGRLGGIGLRVRQLKVQHGLVRR